MLREKISLNSLNRCDLGFGYFCNVCLVGLVWFDG